MESRAHRPTGHAEQFGDLGRGVAHEVVEHEEGPFVGRESPEGAVQLVAVGHAEEVIRGGWTVARQDVQVCDAATLARRLADAHVGQDTVEPAAEPVRIAEARQVTPGDHQRVLQRILGPVDVTKDPMRDREEAVAVQPNQVDERLLVAVLGRFDEIPIHPTVRVGAPIGSARPTLSVGRCERSLDFRGAYHLRMDVQPVRELIEPLVTTAPEGAPEYMFTAGRTLAGQGDVTIASAETARVVASVVDGDEAYDVELASTREGLLARCNCTIGRTTALCPHSFATAFVIWDRG